VPGRRRIDSWSVWGCSVDEGEAYARKLTDAGVRTTSVRVNGTIHDFMMLNPVRGTAATTAALEQAIHILRKALGTA
jgi:acetyl esterase